MLLRPRLSSFISDVLPLEDADRRRVYKGAWVRWYSSPTNRLVYGCSLIVALVVFMFLPGGIDRLFGYHAWYFTVAALVIYLLLLLVVFMVLQRFRFAPCVYAELQKLGIDVCLYCGYWLRDLPPDVQRCPECGRCRAGEV